MRKEAGDRQKLMEEENYSDLDLIMDGSYDYLIGQRVRERIEASTSPQQREEIRQAWGAVEGQVFKRIDGLLPEAIEHEAGLLRLAQRPITMDALDLAGMVDIQRTWKPRYEFMWWAYEELHRGELLEFYLDTGAPIQWEDHIRVLASKRSDSPRGYLYLDPYPSFGRAWCIIGSLEPYDDQRLVHWAMPKMLSVESIAEVTYASLPTNIVVEDVVPFDEGALTSLIKSMADYRGQDMPELEFGYDDGKLRDAILSY